MPPADLRPGSPFAPIIVALVTDLHACQMVEASALVSTRSGVVELSISVHELPAPGRPVLRIFRGTDLEIEMIAPSSWLRWLEIGAPFTFVVDETGEAITGTVMRVGGAVDAVSQTIKIVGGFAPSAARVLAGMSGNAEFPQQPRAPRSAP